MIMKWVTVEKSPIWPMFAVDTYFVTLMSVAVPMLNETCIDTALQNTGPSQHTPSGKTTNNRSCIHLNLFVQNTCSYTPHGVGSALFCVHGKDMRHQSVLYVLQRVAVSPCLHIFLWNLTKFLIIHSGTLENTWSSWHSAGISYPCSRNTPFIAANLIALFCFPTWNMCCFKYV